MTALLLSFLTLIFINTVHAQEITPSYTIELEQIEASPEAKIQEVNGEIQQQLMEKGYVLSPQPNETAFIFTISDTNLDFTDIIAARSKTSSTLLRINSADPYSYELISSLEQPFQSSLDEIIPQTDCDEATPCVPSIPNKWTGKDSYGWGFQMSGPDVTIPSKDETYFQIFDEEKQMILAENDSTSNESAAKLTFKVQVPPEQKEGNYNGVIKIIALPKL